MKMPARQAFDSMLREYVTNPFKAAGFRVSGQTWRRRSIRGWQVFNIQVSGKKSTTDRVVLTGNLGVRFESLIRLDYPTQPRMWDTVPDEYECDVRKRIGSLMPETDDFWWTITDRVSADVAGVQLASLIPATLDWLHSTIQNAAIERSIIAQRYPRKLAAWNQTQHSPEVS